MLLLVGFALYGLMRLLARSRPGLAIGWPIAVAVALRVIAAAGVSLTSIASELRGGDERTFLGNAQEVVDSGFGSEEWLSSLTGTLHEWLLAVQVWTVDAPDFALRITEIGLAVAGLVLLATAVYELVGPKAAVIAAWILAFEPSGIFFSSLLHKESAMFLAEGLVAFGGARLWKRGDFTSFAVIIAGCLVGVATRPYAGWLLITAGVVIALHAGVRTSRQSEATSLALIAIVAAFVVLATPTVLEASSDESLDENVQQSQDANAADDANLALEQVDFSTREAIITNLPTRIFDVTFKPFVWQLGNSSQRLGAIGGLIVLALLWVLAKSVAGRRGEIMTRAGPLIYLAFFLLVAYSLSTGNAGTGFRYRAHLVALVICIVVALWDWRTERVAQRVPAAATERVPVERYVPTPP
jgi:Dolichyl-phosphate-mannose-protein mannosyltransferase